jgi:hypothetical protein
MPRDKHKKMVRVKCTYFKERGKWYTDGDEEYDEAIFDGCIYPVDYGLRLQELGHLPGLQSGTWKDGHFTITVIGGKCGEYTELVVGNTSKGPPASPTTKQYGKILRSFLTGSHAYGLPGDKSDVDLVVYVSEAEYEVLLSIADNNNDRQLHDEQYLKNNHSASLRFGSLNLLCCLTQEQFACWRRGTRELKAKKPVPRDFACKFFEKLRLEMLKEEVE